MMKRPALLLIGALLGASALAGCQQAANDDPAVATPDSGMSLLASDAQLVLPPVRGNPGAAYFTLTNSGKMPATLTGVTIEGIGSTMMHETTATGMDMLDSVEVPAGGSIRFERGGKHVMAMGLPENGEAATQLNMTLIFADGSKVSAPLRVVKAGDAGMGAH